MRGSRVIASSLANAGPLALVVFALAVRLVAASLVVFLLDNDERAYLAVARSLAEDSFFGRDGVLEAHVSPLFPLLHAAVITIGLPEVTAGQALGTAASSLIPLAVWFLLLRIGDRRTAWLGGIATALWPALVASATRIQPEALMALVLLSASLAWLRGALLTAGLLMGVSSWIRPEGVLVFCVFSATELLSPTITRRRAAAATALGAILVVPIVLWASDHADRFALSGKDTWVYANGVAQHRLRGAPVPRETLDAIIREVESPLAHMSSRPIEFATGYAYRLGVLARHLSRTLGVPGLVLAAWGLASWMRRDPKHARAGAVPLLVILCAIPIGMTLRRHVLVLAPLLVALASDASVRAGTAALARWRRRAEGVD